MLFIQISEAIKKSLSGMESPHMFQEGLEEPLNVAVAQDASFEQNHTTISDQEPSKGIHLAHKIVVFALTILSASSLCECENTPSPWSVMWYSMLEWIYGSPDLTSMKYIQGIMCFLICVVSFSLFVSFYRARTRVNPVVLHVHSLVNMIFVPVTSVSIGAHFGFFFVKLSHTTAYIVELIMVVMCAVLYLWICYNFSASYKSGFENRMGNSLQTKMDYAWVNVLIDTLPLVFSAMPGVLESVIDPPGMRSTAHILVVISVCAALSVICFSLRPFVAVSSNKHILWLSVTAGMFSATWYFSENYKSYGGIHFAGSLVVSIILLFILESMRIECNEIPSDLELRIDNPMTLPMEDIEQEETPATMRPWPFSLFSFHVQDIIIGTFLIFSIGFMLWMNVLTAKRMPQMAALPDIGHEAFNVADVIRTSAQYGTFQFSNLAVIACLGFIGVGYLIYPNKLNVRRPAFCYGILACIRGLAFYMTKMPAPCAGSENCPCADPNILKMIKETNSFSIWLSWLFGMGMHITFPQCGDLIISGHTMFLWLAMRILHDFLPKFLWKPLSSLVNFVISGLVAAAMFYIVIAKNHYSIDVYFGALFTELVWSLYRGAQNASTKIPSSDEYWTVKLVRWIETRPIPLD